MRRWRVGDAMKRRLQREVEVGLHDATSGWRLTWLGQAVVEEARGGGSS